MNTLDLAKLREHVNVTIVDFHESRIKILKNFKLRDLLKKNPYLFRAKHITKAQDLIEGPLDARLALSEERLFGYFLEDLAVYIASQTCGGYKSAAPGVDLEFINGDVHYIVSVKSGPNWGNSSQHKKLAQELRNAEIKVKQFKDISVELVLGICYGKTRSSYMKEGYLKIVGQNFWYLLSGNPDLYTDIIEPIGYQAREHNITFYKRKGQIVNQLTNQFYQEFCDSQGAIDWVKLVQFNSGNYDLGRAWGQADS